MKLATWNVNSIRVRLPQVLDWLKQHGPDMLCLQETKILDEDFPLEAVHAAGYRCVYSGQKTYNGVAIVSRRPAEDVVTALPGRGDAQKRLLAATIDGLRVVNVYVPNGESVGSEKYMYKLSWLELLEQWLPDELRRHPRLAVLGDFNIAPEDRDVHDPKRWEGQVLFSDQERAAFRRLIDLGLVDTFRRFEQPAQTFSWWDYRLNAFQRNAGLRIDHVLASTELAKCCRSCTIDVLPRQHERPSDHAPVVAEFD